MKTSSACPTLLHFWHQYCRLSQTYATAIRHSTISADELSRTYREHADTVTTGCRPTAVRSFASPQAIRWRNCRIFIEAAGDINTATHDGNTLLHCACYNPSPGAVRFLLEQGAGVNARKQVGGDTLHIACRLGHERVSFMLLKHSADINARDASGRILSHGHAGAVPRYGESPPIEGGGPRNI
jgi:ankyrin repeat protein